ncbi:MAG: MFS transporter [Heliobacteriaceae bacterium]|nr:MFS transporter [Heliobacteriaceae bacterium]
MSSKEIKWTIFIITVIGNLIAMLDSTSVNLALYPISRDLGVPITDVQWVIVAYMLVLTVFLPFFGKLGDIIPKNKLFTCGFLTFAFGGILNAMAPSLPMLIFFRCIQALGASAMISNSAAIIALIFKDTNRGKALGINGTVIAVGGMTGPALGGVLINYFGWKAIFLPSVPIALAGAYFAYKLLPSYLPHQKGFKFDYPGFIYFSISLFALLLAISEGYKWGWTSVNIIILSIITLVFGAMFYYRDHKISYPLINFDTFKIRAFALGNLAVLTSYICMFTNGVLLPIFLLEIKGFSPVLTGLLILPYSISMSFTAPLSGRFAGKHGSKEITRIGPVIMIFALLICMTFDENSRIPIIIIASAIMGFGSGLFQSPSNTAIITSVKKTELGMASGILALSRNLGNIMGVALTISLFSNFRSDLLEHGVNYSAAFLQSYHFTMGIGIIFGLICLAFTFFAYRGKPS